MTDCIHSAIAPNMGRCVKCGAWVGLGPEPAASGGDSASLALARFGRAPGSAYLLAPMSDGYWTPWHIAQKALDDITAALANQQGVGGWQPIETAPKDGTFILLYDESREHEYMHGQWVRHGWWSPATNSGRSIVWRDATHWMPLPAPPTQPAGDVGREGVK